MKKSLLFLIALPLLIIASCNKSDRDSDNSTEGAQVLWVINNHINTLIRDVHIVAVVDTIINNIDTADAMVPEICSDSIVRAPDSGPFPILLTINYSDTLICTDEKQKSGVVTALFSGNYSSIGTQTIITTTQYMVEGLLISAEIFMEVIASNSDSTVFNINVNNGAIVNTLKTSNNITIFEGTYQYIQYQGKQTVTALDDDFMINGGGNGISWNGIIYNYQIEKPISFLGDCFYENTGIFRLKATDRLDRVCDLNTSNGACDNLMLVTIPTVVDNEEVRIP